MEIVAYESLFDRVRWLVTLNQDEMGCTRHRGELISKLKERFRTKAQIYLNLVAAHQYGGDNQIFGIVLLRSAKYHEQGFHILYLR